MKKIEEGDYCVLGYLNAGGGADSVDFKIDKYTGTTGGTEGDTTTVTTSIDRAKILSITAVVAKDADTKIPPEFQGITGTQYSVWIDSAGIKIKLHGTNSESILSKDFVVIIMYGK